MIYGEFTLFLILDTAMNTVDQRKFRFQVLIVQKIRELDPGLACEDALDMLQYYLDCESNIWGELWGPASIIVGGIEYWWPWADKEAMDIAQQCTKAV